MHHPRSIAAARRLRIAGLLLLSSRLMTLAACGMLLVSMLAGNHGMMKLGSVLLIIGFMLVIAQWISAYHAGCPLCRTPVLAPMRCVKHRRARSLLGSYRLRVALAIMFRERFRCPYCNESTEMDVGETLRGSRPRGTRVVE